MVLYGDSQYHVFTSTNLLNWKDEHKPIRDNFECPDFFELPVDGDRNNMKWVLIQGSGKYSIGTFDGTEFKGKPRGIPVTSAPISTPRKLGVTRIRATGGGFKLLGCEAHHFRTCRSTSR